MPHRKNGFAPILFLVIIAAIGTAILSSNRFSSKPPYPQVQGLELAKGDDSGSSGGSDSGSHSGDESGKNQPSGSTETSSGGTGSDSSNTSTGNTTSNKSGSGETKKGFEIKKMEVKESEIRTAQEIEDENEIENEIESPETEKIDVNLTEGILEFESKGTSATLKPKKLGKAQNVKLTLKQNGIEQELEVKAEGDHINLVTQNIGAETRFPLTFDKTTGQLLVTTPNGQRIIRILPAQASQIAQTAGIQNQIEKIEIQANTTAGTDEDVVLKLTGKKTGKILGIIDVNQPVEAEIGARSGSIISTTTPFWLRLLSPLIR